MVGTLIVRAIRIPNIFLVILHYISNELELLQICSEHKFIFTIWDYFLQKDKRLLKEK